MDSDDRDDDAASPEESGEEVSPRSFSDLVDAVEERRDDESDEEAAESRPSPVEENDAKPADGGESKPTATRKPEPADDREPEPVSTQEPAPADQGASATPAHETRGGMAGLTDAVERRRALSEWEWVRFGPDAGRWATDVSADPKTDALLEVLGDASNVLLVGPLVCPSEYEACTRLLGTAGATRQNALLVTFTESADDRLDVCRGYLDGTPEQTVVVSVGDHVRSGAAAATVGGSARSPVRIETIPDPGDLVQTGMTISRYLSDWKETDARSVVCFHSLTALLRFADDLRSVFRFLHVLQSHVRATDARAHYHLEADAHDEETMATLRPLFDVVLSYDVDESISVQW